MNNIFEYEIDIHYDITRYNITTEEQQMKEHIDKLLKYCDQFANIEEFMDMLELKNVEMIYHIKFIIDKLYLYYNIYERYIINELNKEYKQYQFILGQQYLNNIINIYINKDVYIYDMKQTILILYDMIRELDKSEQE
uniref:Uncharacterized protein n=1 Tax=viral metagenome TaxID=1070528 RepID=A0A6C0I4V7_9ZZZZ